MSSAKSLFNISDILSNFDLHFIGEENSIEVGNMAALENMMVGQIKLRKLEPNESHP